MVYKVIATSTVTCTYEEEYLISADSEKKAIEKAKHSDPITERTTNIIGYTIPYKWEAHKTKINEGV